jgi:hypothetical protein
VNKPDKTCIILNIYLLVDNKIIPILCYDQVCKVEFNLLIPSNMVYLMVAYPVSFVFKYLSQQVSKLNLTFKEIVSSYKKEPQCKPEVFRSVFVSSSNMVSFLLFNKETTV